MALFCGTDLIETPANSDASLTGDGTAANPLAVDWTAGANQVPVTANAPITGDGTAANPLGIDFAALTPADCQEIANCIVADPTALQTFYAAIHTMMIDYNGGTGVLSIDCNGDGNPFT